MITITNKLETCLVVPDGLGQKGALTLAPKGRMKVEDLTPTLSDAERRGLLKVSYPTKKTATAKDDGKSGKTEKTKA